MTTEQINNNELLFSVRKKLNEDINKLNNIEELIPALQAQINNLQAIKQGNISTDLIVGISASQGSGASATRTITKWSRQTNTTYQQIMPESLVSGTEPGLATPAMVNAIVELGDRLKSLEQDIPRRAKIGHLGDHSFENRDPDQKELTAYALEYIFGETADRHTLDDFPDGLTVVNGYDDFKWVFYAKSKTWERKGKDIQD